MAKKLTLEDRQKLANLIIEAKIQMENSIATLKCWGERCDCVHPITFYAGSNDEFQIIYCLKCGGTMS